LASGNLNELETGGAFRRGETIPWRSGGVNFCLS